ncbi:MAG: hypothetical protein Q7S15_00500 [bacterium]|nr:hypothetical protein [bacterium]
MTPFIVIGAIAVLLVPVGVGAQVGTTSITTVPTTTVDILPQTGDEATTTAPTTRSTFWAILIAIIVLILVVWFVMRAR